ncbi:MAG: isoleucine--tRNA ligase, partial [Nanoarchaeota archaeon]
MKPYSPNDVENRVIDFWSKKKIYEKTKKNREGAKRFYFVDGPPYASGNIHVGTAFNKIMKDAYTRFWRMQGFNVWDQPGYDTHGTPIEVKVEKELGFKNKKDIEKYGVDKFIKKCRSYATRYIDTMSKAFANIGVWQDWDNPYLTLDNRYIEGAWFTFKRAFEKGFLYKGSYPVTTCSRCETVLAYNEVEHKTLTDKSVYVKFPVKGKEKTYLVIWTTTPWTLPANTGVMAHPDYDYAYVKVGDETLIMAADIVERIMTEVIETGNYNVVKKVKGKDLEHMHYDHPLKDLVPALQKVQNAHRVVLSARYVNLESGTGLVHTAPGHGTEDFVVGKETGLPAISPVRIDGTFTPEAGKWLEGKYTKDMDWVIIEKLRERGVLIATEDVAHEYPICWRCKTPLLFINVPQWFFKVEHIKKDLLNENKKINWNPPWAGQRFNDWLENIGDWPVSRQRYWGIPLPIWECSCGHIEVIGSWEELKKKGGLSKEIDFHKPDIDNVTLDCPKCKKKIKRVPDVLDVWFDSGVCSWASLNYPRDKKLFEEMWPTDFQIEGSDQFRGWWNSQMLTSYFTFGKAPYKNILMHGMIMDAKGVKMSKSLGNIVTPEDVIEKYGRDALRFYLLGGTPWNNFFFNMGEAKETHRTFNVYWNTYMFVKTYANSKVKKPVKFNPEDGWILSRMNTLIEKSEYAKNMNLHKFVKDIEDFLLNDFSRWYIKLIRDRVSPGYKGSDRAAAEWTLQTVLKNLTIVMSPIAPYIAEEIYSDVFGDKESVHMEDWPKADKPNKKYENAMEVVKSLVESASAARQEKEIKLRWPVSCLYIKSKGKETDDAIKRYEDAVKLMANVKAVEFVNALPEKGAEFNGGTLCLGDVNMEDAMIRDVIRNTQVLRKQNKLNVMESIHVFFKADKETEKVLNSRK